MLNKRSCCALLVTILLCSCASTDSGDLARDEDLPVLTPASTSPPAVTWESYPDFSELRDAYGRREDFHKRCELKRPADEFMKKVNQKQFREASELTLSWLEGCPVDAQTHLWTAAALRDAGDHTRADIHMRWFMGLTDSAMSSGDGKTQETAFTTISIAEEYAILNRLRLERVTQRLLEGPRLLDAIEAKDKDGNRQTVYFNPYWHFVRLAHMFPEKKKQ